MQKFGLALALAFVSVNASEQYGPQSHHGPVQQYSPAHPQQHDFHGQHAGYSSSPVVHGHDISRAPHVDIHQVADVHKGHVDIHAAHDSYKADPHAAIASYVKQEEKYDGPDHPIWAKCILKDPEEEDYVGGVINFVQYPGQKTQLYGRIQGITPGLHGFHIHELGDLSEGCASTGGHYNPKGVDHGAHFEDAHNRHDGDLAQVKAGYNGRAVVEQTDCLVDLYGEESVIGRGLVLHAGEDDLGRGGDAGSRANGNAGARIACCVIGLTRAPPSKH